MGGRGRTPRRSRQSRLGHMPEFAKSAGKHLDRPNLLGGPCRGCGPPELRNRSLIGTRPERRCNARPIRPRSPRHATTRLCMPLCCIVGLCSAPPPAILPQSLCYQYIYHRVQCWEGYRPKRAIFWREAPIFFWPHPPPGLKKILVPLRHRHLSPSDFEARSRETWPGCQHAPGGDRQRDPAA